MREIVSVPITSTRSAPIAIRPWPVIKPYMKPEQAALTSNAPQRMPSSFCTAAALPHCLSGVVVASTSASTRRGSRPAISSAWRPDSTDSPIVLPPMRRSWMPVRDTIHSSLVSIISASSWLVSTFSGRAVPQPEITPPLVPGRIAGISPSWASGTVTASAGAQPRDGLTGSYPFGVDGDEALQHPAERRPDLVLADVTEQCADVDRGSGLDRHGREDPRRG